MSGWQETTRVKPGSLDDTAEPITRPSVYVAENGAEVEAFRILYYGDFGPAVRWCATRGATLTYSQEDPGPVVGHLDAGVGGIGQDPVYVGQFLVKGFDEGDFVEAFYPHEFHEQFKAVTT